MKLYKLAIPKLVAYSILFPLIPSLWWIILNSVNCSTNKLSGWIHLIASIVGCIIFDIAFVFYFRNSFCLYRITEQGISNRYMTINWEDVNSYTAYPVEVFIFSRFNKTELAQVCVFPTTKAYSYRELDPHKCVFFEVTKENLLLIKQYCVNPSESIQDFLMRYSYLWAYSTD